MFFLFLTVMPPPPPPPPAGRPRNISRGSDDDRRTPDTQQAAYNPHAMYGKCACSSLSPLHCCSDLVMLIAGLTRRTTRM